MPATEKSKIVLCISIRNVFVAINGLDVSSNNQILKVFSLCPCKKSFIKSFSCHFGEEKDRSATRVNGRKSVTTAKLATDLRLPGSHC